MQHLRTLLAKTVHLGCATFASYLTFVGSSWSYGWDATLRAGSVGVIYTSFGVLFLYLIDSIAIRELPREYRKLMVCFLLTMPVLLGLIPGRIEEVVVYFRAKPTISHLANVWSQTGRYPLSLNNELLPTGANYVFRSGMGAYVLVFRRPTYPSSTIEYSPLRGWEGDD